MSYTAQQKLAAAARTAVQCAIRKGALAVGTICEDCGATRASQRIARLQAHHNRGYQREHWLSIVWLCAKCHKRRHMQEAQS